MSLIIPDNFWALFLRFIHSVGDIYVYCLHDSLFCLDIFILVFGH